MKRIFCLVLLATLAVATPAAAQSGTVSVTLAEQNSSGISGTATLTQVGADVKVDITVTGMTATGDHPAHIHSGKCPSPGAVVHPLTNVVAGRSTTTLTGVTLASVTDGNHAINLHESATSLANYVACGDIAAAAAEPDTSAPTASATGAAAPAATSAVPAAMPATGAGGGSAAPWPLLVVGLVLALAVVWPRLRAKATTDLP
jgi:hypothetical protein